MTTVTDIFAAGLDQVRRSWGWFLVFGILLTVLGVLCVGKAQTATIFSILVLGWILAISGVLWLVNAFRAFSWHGFFLFLLNAIIRGATDIFYFVTRMLGQRVSPCCSHLSLSWQDCSARSERASSGSQGGAGQCFRESYLLYSASHSWPVGPQPARTLLAW